MHLIEEFFDDRGAASRAAALHMADTVAAQLAIGGPAAMVASGGSTPIDALQELGRQDLAWERVSIVPSDERWVPRTHKDSNERMLRETLLDGNARAATVLSLYRENETPESASRILEEELEELPLPFCVSLLGMGEDGHFASLFPDGKGDGFESALDPDGERAFVPVTTKSSPHPRITLTLSTLAHSEEVILLIFGDAKKRVYKKAKAANSRLPVARLLHQKRAPVRVIWAP